MLSASSLAASSAPIHRDSWPSLANLGIRVRGCWAELSYQLDLRDISWRLVSPGRCLHRIVWICKLLNRTWPTYRFISSLSGVWICKIGCELVNCRSKNQKARLIQPYKKCLAKPSLEHFAGWLASARSVTSNSSMYVAQTPRRFKEMDYWL